MKYTNSFIPFFKSTFLLVCFFVALGNTCWAQVSPEIEWKVLKLKHLNLVYDAKHQELANLYADRLEASLQELKKYFTSMPEKLTVVLNDKTDLTNGYATPFPYPLMMIFPVLPGPSETISQYGDWALELSMHEMVHILSFEPKRGILKGLNSVFGSVISPHILLPRWWLEGVAVDLETRTSSHGRLRSVYQDAAIRSYYLSESTKNRLDSIPLSEINEVAIPTWPFGARPYLFGSLMWSQLLADWGHKSIQELHYQYGGRIPFTIEGPYRDLSNETYSQLFTRVKNDIEKRTETQLEVSKTKPLTSGQLLDIEGSEENSFPVISPDGLKMLLFSRNKAGRRSVVILQRPSSNVPFDQKQKLYKFEQNSDLGGIDEKLDSPPSGTIQRVSWYPDSQSFVFDQVQIINRFRDSSDLYKFDLKTMKKEKLTNLERAREASVSPDGKKIAFIKLDAGRMHLAVLNIESKKSQLIYSPEIQNRISWPTFINSDELVFTERSQGREILQKMSLTSKIKIPLLQDHIEAKYPIWTSRGLLFSSSKNGVQNLYIANPELKSVSTLTHSATWIGAASLDLSLNNIYYSELSSDGFRIKQTTIKELGEIPTVQPLLAERYPAAKTEISNVDKSNITSYSAWPYLIPKYWIPNFSWTQESTTFGATTSSADPLGKHAYQIYVDYETAQKDTSSAFAYTNNSTNALLGISGSDDTTSAGNSSLRFRQQQYQARALWQLESINPQIYLGPGITWISRNFSSSRKEQYGPSAFLNYSEFFQGGWQISPESGFGVGLEATDFMDNGSRGQEVFRLYRYSLQKYFSGWISRHAVMLRLQGQYIDGKVTTPQFASTTGLAPAANFAGGGVIPPFFIARGYREGQFLAKNLNLANLEYRFPIKALYRGPDDTSPFFFKQIHGAAIVDAVQADGFIYKDSTERYVSADKEKIYFSSGFELKLDLTLGYQIPITAYLGVYFPENTEYAPSSALAFSLQF